MVNRDPASYRDPDGYVTHHDGAVYRLVLNQDATLLNPKYSKFFEQAVARGLLVPFEKTTSPPPGTPKGAAAFTLKTLPVISYPYEWGFAQLKDAALTTLEIGLLALKHGLTLKDATAFNIQQDGGRMVFIDHTSFEETDDTLPWRPYSQFCRHFLAPLLVTSKRGINANKRFRTNLDGMALAEACMILPFLSRFRPAVFMHLYLHSFMINRHKHDNAAPKDSDTAAKKPADRPGSQTAYLEHLKRVVEKIPAPNYGTEWHDYYNNTNYDARAFSQKESALQELVGEQTYDCIWDIGGNNGHFSRLLASSAQNVVCMDVDYAAVDLNYLKNKAENKTNITPLVMDFTNPSPALGVGNSERPPIDDRAQPDLIVALAVIHHLTITYNIPFEMTAAHLRRHNADLIIEYVGREDSQIQKLLRHKDDPYDHYNQDTFEEQFYKAFKLTKKIDIEGTQRCLYFLSPR